MLQNIHTQMLQEQKEEEQTEESFPQTAKSYTSLKGRRSELDREWDKCRSKN